jgi:glycerophosphoryl diester phosphodiesterase
MLDRSTFLRPIAHRGLHDISRGIVENTAPAFEAAVAAGYGIECDIRPIQDGTPVVFHDETLDRLVDVEGLVSTLSEPDLEALRHRIGGAGIMTLARLLALVDGKAPLLIEIKSEWDPPDGRFLARIAALVGQYGGPVALMSFDPDVMKDVRRTTRDIPCGIISGSYEGPGWWAEKLTSERRSALRNLLESASTAPDFYAYEIDALPTPVTEYVRRVSGLPVFTWTVRTEAQRRNAETSADAIIFEGLRP